MSRVLFVAQVYARFPNDMLGSFLHRLAKALVAKGCQVHVVAPWGGAEPEAEIMDNVHVRRFRVGNAASPLAYTGEMHQAARRRPWEFLRFLGTLEKEVALAVREVAPDVVHSHWWFPTGFAVSRALRQIDSGRKIPHVISLHGTDVRLLDTFPGAPWLARGVLEGADCLLPVSEFLASRLRHHRVRPQNVEVLPMPFDEKAFRLGAWPRPPDFLCIARLTQQKRHDVVLRAFQSVVEAVPEAHLHLAGDGPERPSLLRLCNELGIEGRVTFHGTLPATEVGHLARRSRAVVLASEREGYGLALVEGGHAGCALLGVNSGAISELIEPGKTGFLTPSGSKDELGNAMLQLARDADLAERMGRDAHAASSRRGEALIAERLVQIDDQIKKGGLGSSISPP